MNYTSGAKAPLETALCCRSSLGVARDKFGSDPLITEQDALDSRCQEIRLG